MTCNEFHKSKRWIKDHDHTIIRPKDEEVKSHLGEPSSKHPDWYKAEDSFWKLHCEFAHKEKDSDSKTCMEKHRKMKDKLDYATVDTKGELHEWGEEDFQKECENWEDHKKPPQASSGSETESVPEEESSENTLVTILGAVGAILGLFLASRS